MLKKKKSLIGHTELTVNMLLTHAVHINAGLIIVLPKISSNVRLLTIHVQHKIKFISGSARFPVTAVNFKSTIDGTVI
jgi:hypothetical protein